MAGRAAAGGRCSEAMPARCRSKLGHRAQAQLHLPGQQAGAHQRQQHASGRPAPLRDKVDGGVPLHAFVTGWAPARCGQTPALGGSQGAHAFLLGIVARHHDHRHLGRRRLRGGSRLAAELVACHAGHQQLGVGQIDALPDDAADRAGLQVDKAGAFAAQHDQHGVLGVQLGAHRVQVLQQGGAHVTQADVALGQGLAQERDAAGLHGHGDPLAAAGREAGFHQQVVTADGVGEVAARCRIGTTPGTGGGQHHVVQVLVGDAGRGLGGQGVAIGLQGIEQLFDGLLAIARPLGAAQVARGQAGAPDAGCATARADAQAQLIPQQQ